MLWLEMSRDNMHGGEGWGFTQALWSPTRKRLENGQLGGSWPYWESILRVQAGDTIFHLKENHGLAFVGYSTADTNGYKTSERPPYPDRWGYDTYFYRASLRDFQSFPMPFGLQKIFQQQSVALREYFERNKARGSKQKRLLFYVIQAGRLQCQNGGYLSEVDQELQDILFNSFLTESKSESTTSSSPTLTNIRTSESIQEIRIRIGQNDFSQRVRANYNHCCCFPGCNVSEDRFLIGSHIARWSDVVELRGNLGNGLCLCLMHDKAFEVGLFTIDADLHILVNCDNSEVKDSEWAKMNLFPYDGQSLKSGHIPPSHEALAHHWKRFNIRF